MKSFKDVDEYIASAHEDVQGKLRELRSIIKSVAPETQEKISYGMPYYEYRGRLVYFAYFKNHIGIYIPTPVIEEHQDELKDYETAKATVRFPLDKNLPASLIKKLIKARVIINEMSYKKK